MGTIVNMADLLIPLEVDTDVMTLMEKLNLGVAHNKAFILLDNSAGEKVVLSIADIRTAVETEDF